MGGQLIVYRLALDDDSRSELETRKLHSDDPIYGTFTFDDSEIYYQVGLHYHGSPWNRPGSPRMFKLSFPGDHPLHGVKKFNISRYGSAQNEATAYYTIGRTGRPDAPSPHGDYRFVRWELFGADQGVMSHVETVDSSYLSRRFASDEDGLLLRANGKITFHIDDTWGLTRWAAFQYLGADRESYRWNWDLHTRTLEDDWPPLIALMKVMDVGQTPTGPAFDSAVKDIVDLEEWARVLAVRALNDDWDAIGIGNGQNGYLYYAPLEKRWKYLPWDMDHTFDVNRVNSAPLFPTADPGFSRLLGRPEFRRMYLQTFKSMLQTTWNSAWLAKVLDPTGAAGVGNGDSIKAFVTNRTALVQSSLGGNVTFRIRTSNGRDLVVSTPTATLDGDAPLEVKTILLNGDPLSGLTWTAPTAWRVVTPVESGINHLEFTAFDRDGTLVATAAMNVTSTYQWNAPAITSVTPANGGAAGGTPVVIAGSDFHEGVKVSFGTTAATSVEFVSATEIRAVTPAGFGQVDVTASNLDGKSGVKPAAFTFIGPKFIRGDADGDGLAKLNDVLAVLGYLFRQGSLDCLEAADANDDAAIDVSDAVRLLLALFAGAAPLPPPYPDVGSDPTPDGLGCASG
jgi:hypothetical protein